MSQLSSSTTGVTSRGRDDVLDYSCRSMADQGLPDFLLPPSGKEVDDGVFVANDVSNLPDACLASIFHFLGPGDRKRCSLVCRRWLDVEGQSRHRLSLNAQSDLLSVVPSLFSRFDAVTKLSLKCERRSVSIGDDALILISLRCQNLTRLKLRSCRQLTDLGMESFAKNCKKLKKLSCGSCTFGAKGMNAVVDNCSLLEELSVKRLRGLADGASTEPIRPGLAAASLKIICLTDLYNGQCFGPLIMGSKNLRTLRLFRCSGDWDNLLEVITNNVKPLVEVHLERLQVTDIGLASLSNCRNLEILRLLKTPDCSNLGLTSVAQKCKLLRKLHIDGWKTNRINDEGLIGVAKYCLNLQELVLISVNPTSSSLERLGSNCRKLERLALYESETIGDAEISCIAAKCTALRKLCIKSCPVSDHGMEALAVGCPNLVKITVKKCKGVTYDGAGWLRASKESLAVNIDACSRCS
ncbi:F-box protein At1g47056-like [Cynara cardunculus var. scolymus]|uniref:F-box domain, cyclin-like protein n=1 Tax=Cynara cardunculus var. scolymus TaxID=59895 RepID=A0A103XWQ5_CYNCS|nr:F-box protein At1g47056-like [Cynara cardunculus var. scolymus]KVH98318.1 F-box domain, cyclin-like protein [Cynara cardunculus var. scolymus]